MSAETDIQDIVKKHEESTARWRILIRTDPRRAVRAMKVVGFNTESIEGDTMWDGSCIMENLMPVSRDSKDEVWKKLVDAGVFTGLTFTVLNCGMIISGEDNMHLTQKRRRTTGGVLSALTAPLRLVDSDGCHAKRGEILWQYRDRYGEEDDRILTSTELRDLDAELSFFRVLLLPSKMNYRALSKAIAESTAVWPTLVQAMQRAYQRKTEQVYWTALQIFFSNLHPLDTQAEFADSVIAHWATSGFFEILEESADFLLEVPAGPRE